MLWLFVLAGAALVDDFVRTDDLPSFYSHLLELKTPDALYLRGLMIFYNLIEHDRPTAYGLTLLNIAALEGDRRAKQAISYREFTGWSLVYNCTSAEKAYADLSSEVAAELYEGKIVRVNEQRRVNEFYTDAKLIREQDFLIQIKPNSVEANRIIGERYYFGIAGYPQDFAKAYRYMLKASTQVPASSANTLLGEMHEYGRGVDINYKDAASHYWIACQVQDFKACGAYGKLLLEGKGIEASSTDARQWLIKAAEKNDPSSLYQLGKLLIEGDSWVEEDSVKGRNYMNLAMARGVTLAAYELAALEHYGIGLYRNCNTATGLYKTVAEQGTLIDDYKQAYKSFIEGRTQEAALRFLILGDQGLRNAQFNAGFLLDKFKMGVAAKLMLEQAAEQGDLDALVELGDMFYYGTNLEQNYTTALAYYKHAERLKHKQAQFNIAYMHHFGQGVPQDSNLAKRIYDDLLHHEDAQASAWLMLACIILEEWAVVATSLGVAVFLGLLVK